MPVTGVFFLVLLLPFVDISVENNYRYEEWCYFNESMGWRKMEIFETLKKRNFQTRLKFFPALSHNNTVNSKMRQEEAAWRIFNHNLHRLLWIDIIVCTFFIVARIICRTIQTWFFWIPFNISQLIIFALLAIPNVQTLAIWWKMQGLRKLATDVGLVPARTTR